MKHISRLSLLFVLILVGFGLGAVLRLEAIRPGGAPRPAQPAAAAEPGVVANGSFEEIDGKLPRGWRVSNRSPIFSVDAAAHTGKASVKVSSADGADAWWFAAVPVKPYAKYRLSGWIRTEKVEAGTGRGALLNLHGIGGAETKPLTGTQDWTRVELVFDSGANDAVQVNCLLGGWGRSTGAAWYDDIQLEELSVRTLEPAVTIRAGATRAPMSKYIYGQFIEHLGRCIYGGIWAEMLEDRKFFYNVGAKESPWTPIGNAAGVAMNTAAPYVGAHTPDVTLAGAGQAGGIQQGELGVTAGKKYVGRVVLAGDAGVGAVRVTLVWGAGEKDRETMTIAGLAPAFKPFPIAFTPGATTDTARLEIAAAGKGVLRIGTASLMPADNVEGFRAGHPAAAARAECSRLSLARRQLRQRLRLARRPRRSRQTPASKEPGVAGRRAQRCRHPRVHGALSPARHRALHRGEQRPGRRDVGGRRSGVRQRRGDDDAGEGAGGERPQGAVRVPLLVDRQRDVRQLAARLHVAGEVPGEAQRVRTSDAREGRVDHARRRRRGGPVDRGNADQLR